MLYTGQFCQNWNMTVWPLLLLMSFKQITNPDPSPMRLCLLQCLRMHHFGISLIIWPSCFIYGFGFFSSRILRYSWHKILCNFRMYNVIIWFVVVQLPTCSSQPLGLQHTGFPVPHYLLELAQAHIHWISDAIQPSHLLSPSPSAFNLPQHQGLFQ